MKKLDFNEMMDKLKELGADEECFIEESLPIEENSLVNLDHYEKDSWTFDEVLTEEEAEIIFSKG